MKSLLKFLLNVAIYVAVVVAIVWGAPKLLSDQLGTQYPIASITSGSMWPELKEGDMIFIKSVPKEALEIGDVVVWQNPRGFTIHRLVKLNETTFVTKGDANFKEDDPVRYEDLVGRTVEFRGWPIRLPYFGYVTIYASKFFN